MFTAQLAAFLQLHHHAQWVTVLVTGGHPSFSHIYTWALRHGFVFIR